MRNRRVHSPLPESAVGPSGTVSAESLSRVTHMSNVKANPAPGKPERGYTENGTRNTQLAYSEVNTTVAFDASGISGAVSPSQTRIGPSRTPTARVAHLGRGKRLPTNT